MSSQDKSPDAFRTISEVAEDLDLPQHVLRFWETRFSQIKPLKRGGGRRYYRPDDVELLRGIRHLLYGEGYTIKGVQRILKEQGSRYVMQIWQDGGLPPDTADLSENGHAAPVEAVAPAPADANSRENLPNGVLAEAAQPVEAEQSHGLGILGRLRGEKTGGSGPAVQTDLSKDDVRRLQATLFELLECKRTLDQAR